MERVRKLAVISVAAAGVIFGAVLFFRYAVGILLPFAAGALVALLAKRPANAVAARFRFRASLVRVVFAAVFGTAFFALLAFCVRRLARELILLAGVLAEGGEAGALSAVSDLFARYPWLSRLFPDAGTMLSAVGARLSEEVLRLVPGAFAAAVTALPDLLFGFAVFLFSAFYFCRDGEKIAAAVTRVLPRASWRESAHSAFRAVARACFAYLCVYGALTVLNFSLLLSAFLLLGVHYAWLLAFAFALLDLLPVIGVGTFLLPWAAASFALGQPGLGAGLLATYAVILVVRRFAEGKWLGKKLGIHPLLMLLLLFAGFRLFGIVGMLASPLVAAFLSSFFAALSENGRRKEKPHLDAVEL